LGADPQAIFFICVCSTGKDFGTIWGSNLREDALMTSAFSKLTLHTDQPPGRGIEIRSPVSGLVNKPDDSAGPVC